MKKLIAVIAFALAAFTSSTNVATADSTYPYSGPKGDRSAAAMWVDSQHVLSGWSKEKTMELALMICHRLVVQNYSEGQLIAEVSDGDSAGLPGVKSIVHAAEWHYCPSEY